MQGTVEARVLAEISESLHSLRLCADGVARELAKSLRDHGQLTPLLCCRIAETVEVEPMLLFANVDGEKAPFTASRPEDRQDLLKLERELKAQGMDVDVQRYYLIQVPLRRDAPAIRLSNMAPPWERPHPMPMPMPPPGVSVPDAAGVAGGAPMATAPPKTAAEPQADEDVRRQRADPGLGAGQRGARAEEPVRVTVVYFVTPVGRVTAKDMANFASAFAVWDDQAIWGGSFVVKETK